MTCVTKLNGNMDYATYMSDEDDVQRDEDKP
jgi:hypothetical protein